jgi:hypothetical protein
MMEGVDVPRKIDFAYDGGKPGVGGTGTIFINGKRSRAAVSRAPFRLSRWLLKRAMSW